MSTTLPIPLTPNPNLTSPIPSPNNHPLHPNFTSISPSASSSATNEPVDPRVHIELDRLNNATSTINHLETNLGEARAAFRHLLCESTQRIEELRVKMGACVDKARPYYEARFQANESLRRSQLAAMRYERANSAHSAAREMVYLAEQGLGGRTLDPAWQEMLNHATQRVNDAEKERILSEGEHKFAYMKHEATNAKVKQLQKDLKRAITKSSLSIRRSFLEMSSIANRHELMLLPYYEMKAQFNHMLELQRNRVNNLEHQVQTSKLTYADALRNLEQISDEIHRIRNTQKTYKGTTTRQISNDSTGSSYVDDFSDEFHGLPSKLNPLLTDPAMDPQSLDGLDGYRNIISLNYVQFNGSTAKLPEVENGEIVLKHSSHSSSNEWTEINLDVSSPEEDQNKDGTYNGDLKLDGAKQKLIRQNTLPNPRIENEYSSIKSKLKLDHSISTWISRSSAVKEDFEGVGSTHSSRRQSLDNILGSTNEKMKEIFSQGMMMLNISSAAERKHDGKSNGFPEEKGRTSKKLPSPLEKTLTYLNVEDDNSDTESCSSTDMLNEDQISSLMLDKDLGVVCEQVLGTPLDEIVSFPKELKSSSQNDEMSKP